MYKKPHRPSGHIPECPFTTEVLLARGTRKKQFSTLDYLKEKEECGLGSSGLRFYQELERAVSKVRFCKFVSARFAYPLVEDIAAPEAHRKIRYKIEKYLPQVISSDLKYLFILETDAVQHFGMDAYHCHFLISKPGYFPGQFDRLPPIIRLRYDTLNRQLKEQEFQDVFNMSWTKCRTELMTDPFEILIYKKTKRTKLENVSNLNHINSVVIEDIYNQECLTDYLFKKLTKPGFNFIVDYDHSSIEFK
jgi:hypothetical protein